ncbi:MAG: response regulator [Vulcanimicrobiaceae bacterium]
MVAEDHAVPRRILVVDDEPQIGNVLKAYLERDGFVADVRTNVTDALASIEASPPDLMLLDLNLPDGNGLDILRSVGDRRIPTIIVSARTEEVDRIVGLEMGADDYVIKPFSPREVVARVRAVFRRLETREGTSTRATHIGEMHIDFSAHEVRIADQPISLTPSEFRILGILAEHPGHVFSRAHLLDVLQDDGSIFERTLDRHINNLRRKIEPNPSQPEYVITVYGVGYKMRRP